MQRSDRVGRAHPTNLAWQVEQQHFRVRRAIEADLRLVVDAHRIACFQGHAVHVQRTARHVDVADTALLQREADRISLTAFSTLAAFALMDASLALSPSVR